MPTWRINILWNDHKLHNHMYVCVLGDNFLHCTICYWLREGVKRYWANNTVGWEELFDLDLWTCDLKINRDHLLINGNPCTKFGIDQVNESKDIERTTQLAEKSGLTLTFEHVTSKSIGIIYSLRATPARSMLLIKRRGQRKLTGQHSGLRRVIWPWPLNMWPQNQ